MFYIKYRPRTIEELDNEDARLKLTNILKNASLPHALLFSGQKGTGKTSTARIFAKSINCEQNIFAKKSTSYEPCNRCTNCLTIEASSCPDVTELDAASNRGIEDIRTLIRDAVFAPMTGRYRVYIIDEAHMITKEGCNALLKTLEEPPDSAIFILATTNEEKLPETIRSRTMKIPFGHAKQSQVIRMLKRIIKHESLTVPEETIELIASRSDNSFRDAAKLLEELVIQNMLAADDATAYLKIRSTTSFLELIAEKNEKEVFSWISQFAETGGSFSYLIEEILEELRIQLLIKSGIAQSGISELNLSKSSVIRLMKLFSEAYTALKLTPIESLPLEIAVAQFYNQKRT